MAQMNRKSRTQLQKEGTRSYRGRAQKALAEHRQVLTTSLYALKEPISTLFTILDLEFTLKPLHYNGKWHPAIRLLL